MCMGEAGLLKIVVYGIIVCMHTMVKTPLTLGLTKFGVPYASSYLC